MIIIIFVPLLSCSSSQSYYVSLEGNDANSGTKEKPFASLERVQEIIRKRALQGNRKKIEVYMDSGTYYLQSPLSFL
ncbi:MAG: hypothetical protein KDC53_25245, partial [Saprospiraceae bacterium]|nr:hypothetical protein [Saprospiraceae bacterium]